MENCKNNCSEQLLEWKKGEKYEDPNGFPSYPAVSPPFLQVFLLSHRQKMENKPQLLENNACIL